VHKKKKAEAELISKHMGQSLLSDFAKSTL
jgi:hypothetical protein